MLNNSRKLLCFILTMIMATGIFVFLLSVVVRTTICNQAYVENFFCTSKITAYCDEVYNQRISLLAENSDIPLQVFEANDNHEGYNNTVIQRFFEGSDTTIFTRDKINTYEKLIKEYLDGNEFSYDNDAVHYTAVKAAEIYADSYGLKNVDAFKHLIDDFIACFDRVSSIALALVLYSSILLSVLYTNKKKVLKYFSSAFVSAGAGMVLSALLALVFGLGKGAQISPDIYQNAIFNSISVMFFIVMVSGGLVIALAEASLLRHYRMTKKTRNG